MRYEHNIRDLFREVLGISDFQWEGDCIQDGLYRHVCTVDEFKVKMIEFFVDRGWCIQIADKISAENKFLYFEHDNSLQGIIDLGKDLLDAQDRIDDPEWRHCSCYMKIVNNIFDTEITHINMSEDSSKKPPKGRSQEQHNRIVNLNSRKFMR